MSELRLWSCAAIVKKEGWPMNDNVLVNGHAVAASAAEALGLFVSDAMRRWPGYALMTQACEEIPENSIAAVRQGVRA